MYILDYCQHFYFVDQPVPWPYYKRLLVNERSKHYPTLLETIHEGTVSGKRRLNLRWSPDNQDVRTSLPPAPTALAVPSRVLPNKSNIYKGNRNGNRTGSPSPVPRANMATVPHKYAPPPRTLPPDSLVGLYETRGCFCNHF